MYKIAFFIPKERKEDLKGQLFKIGVGQYNGYAECSWECEGTGQFRPQNGSNPFIGSENVLERVTEFRVEMVCEDHLIKQALQTLIKYHPYEEPAYEAWKIETLESID